MIADCGRVIVITDCVGKANVITDCVVERFSIPSLGRERRRNWEPFCITMVRAKIRSSENNE